MNCKDFHIEVEAGLKDTRLSASAEEHAAACPPCHEFNQKHVEFREWLTVCRTITAPKNFQFGVQRKIAGTSSTHSQDWLWRGLRYIVPAAGMAAVLALVLSYSLNNTGGAKTDISAAATNSVTAQEAPKPAIAAVDNVDNNTVIDSTQKLEQDKIAALPANANKQENSRVPAAVDPQGGSKDSGGGSITQAVGNSARELPAGINEPGNKSLTLSERLIALGKFGVLAGTNLTVKGLKPGSPAERSGVKEDDVVESLNGNILTVKRGVQTVTITLK